MSGDLFADVSGLRSEIQSLRARLEQLEAEAERLAASVGSIPLAVPVRVDEDREHVAPGVGLPPPVPASAEQEAEALHRVVVDDRQADRSAGGDGEPSAPTGGVSLEQRVGASWLNKAGIAAMVLASVFFFKYSIQRGWVPPVVRVCIVALAGVALIGLGTWAYRRAMRIFAAGVTAGGIVLLYGAAYAASPRFYGLLTTPWAFALMCAVTVIGVAISLRSRQLSTTLLTLIGAYATPLLLPSADGALTMQMNYLLTLGLGFLSIGVITRWPAVGPLTLAGTLVVFTTWFANHYAVEVATSTTAYAWALFALFAGYASMGNRAGRVGRPVAMAVTGAAGAALVAVTLVQIPGLSGAAAVGHVLALDVIVLAVCLWRRWDGLRVAALCWTALGMVITWSSGFRGNDIWFWSTWTWVFYGLFAADVLIRLPLRAGRFNNGIAIAIVTASTGVMFLATFTWLDPVHHAWMGLYTVVLGLVYLGLWFAARRLPGRVAAAALYLYIGLALLVVAAPIQFSLASLTIAWAVQAVVAMALARRLTSKTMLIKSLVVLALALGHFMVDYIAILNGTSDGSLAQILVTIGAEKIPRLLALALLLTASFALCAVLMLRGKAIFGRREDRGILCGLLWVGAVLWASQTAGELSATTATWCWLAFVGFVMVLGAKRRNQWLQVHVGLMALVTMGKFVSVDTLAPGLAGTLATTPMVVLNWQTAAAAVMVVVSLWSARAIKEGGGDNENLQLLGGALVAVAALLVVWAGTVEVARCFPGARVNLFTGVIHAQQMAYSLWWTLCAIGLLVLGFIRRNQLLRYLALTLFGVTMIKVVSVDMANVEAAYRIASFLVLGAAMVGGSLLYQRCLKLAAAADAPSDDGLDDSPS